MTGHGRGRVHGEEDLHRPGEPVIPSHQVNSECLHDKHLIWSSAILFLFISFPLWMENSVQSVVLMGSTSVQCAKPFATVQKNIRGCTGKSTSSTAVHGKKNVMTKLGNI